jgi:hypothetical protein
MNSPVLNVATREQQGGTCWFHAIMNGLLMSQRPRHYLRQLLKDKGINTNLISNACPRTIDGFWRYIAYRLKGPRTISPRIRNVNVIKASGARRRFANPLGFIPRKGNTKSNYTRRIAISRSSVTGGTISDLYNIYKKLFGSDFSYKNSNTKSTPAFIMKKGNDLDTFTKHNGTWYYLSHAYIKLKGKGGFWGHVVSGYINSHDNYKMFDSNRSDPVDWIWRTSRYDDEYLKWFNTIYKLPSMFGFVRIQKWGIYIRSDL